MLNVKKTTNLIIGAVHSQCPRFEMWANLQHDFISENTSNFEYVVYTNGHVDQSCFKCKVIGGEDYTATSSQTGLEQSNNHFHGLNVILNYFREHKAAYYLLLDSDCFPINPNWQDILIKQMARWSKDIAAPLRFENLDVFPHPCAFFMSHEALHSDWFNLGVSPNKNLLGQDIKDVGCKVPVERCYPLLKTNTISPHTNFSIIYSHLFYHHTCGSRSLLTRSINSGYYRHIVKNSSEHWNIEEKLYNRLVENPQEYIRWLTQCPI